MVAGTINKPDQGECRMRTLKILLSLSLAVGLFACEKKDDEARKEIDKGTASASAPKGKKSVDVTADEIVVKLVEAGAEPRKPLRYQFKAGRKDKLVMDMKMSMTLAMGGASQPETVLPISRTTMQINSVSVSPEGNLKYEFEVTDAVVTDKNGALPIVVSTMETELKKTVGMSGWAIVTPRGFTEDAEINVPEGASPQLHQMVDNLRQQIRQLSSPLPEEPVGIGAKWEVTMPLNTDALKLIQTASYELKTLEGTTGKLGIQVAQTAKPQQMNLPNMPPGTKTTLTSLKTKASGTANFDLTQPVPKSELSLATNMKMNVSAQGQSSDVTTDMKIDIKIHP
jgi:hypothetical protein